jgi:hypothetical protein
MDGISGNFQEKHRYRGFYYYVLSALLRVNFCKRQVGFDLILLSWLTTGFLPSFHITL